MKKINLESLLDSLDSNHLEEASQQLHNWLVGEGKRIHAELNGIVESDETDEETDEVSEGITFETEIVTEAEDEWLVEVSYTGDDQADNHQDHIETILGMKASDADMVGDKVYLSFYVNGEDHAREAADDVDQLKAGIPGLEIHCKMESMQAEDLEVFEEGKVPTDDTAAEKNTADDSETPGEVDDELEEARIDELSPDSMMAYAKKARRDRDRPSADDEKVGRRTIGLDMVANKARRMKAQPQYESEAESEEALIADLAEAFAGLKTISHKQTKDGSEVGKGGNAKTNTKSPLPMKKKDKRDGGEAVEIKSDDHTGFDMEKSPKVKDAPSKDVENAKHDPKKVSMKGGKSLLNKKDGFGNDSPESPISGKLK